MTESVKQRINALSEFRDASELRKLHETILADLTALRAPLAGLISGSATYDPASLADGAGATTTVTVTGAALGDYVVGVSFGLDLQGITLTGYVSAANTVAVRFQNESGGVLDLASSTLRAVVLPAATFAAPAALNLIA